MLVSIVILTYRRSESVHNLLSQLTAIQDPGMEIIVVDNGSGPETAPAINKNFPLVKLVVLPENKGVGSRNRGMEIAMGEIVVTLDDDMVDFSSDDLNYLRTTFSENKELGAVNFKVVWPGTEKVRDWVHRRPIGFSESSFPTYEITEGAVAWRRSALQQVGYYREDFFISHEGLELSLRMLEGGWKIIYDGTVSVGHAHALGGRTSWRRYYYDTRNLFPVAALHMPLGFAARYLFVGCGAMFVYSLRDRHLFAWVRAMVSGWARFFQMWPERRVWGPKTQEFIDEADSWRPGFWAMVIKRLRQKDFSME
ncbi:MAG: glycosyltransferase family 2 protein [bacterium]|nr:glycosyltransferase family 2 protein [bacterium]